MKNIRFPLLLVILFCVSILTAQSYYPNMRKLNNTKSKNYVDTSTSIIMLNASFAYQLPFGNGYLANTFSNNYNIGVNATAKTAGNWTYDLGFNYMFGSEIKSDYSEIFGDAMNSNNEIIDANGMAATIYLEGRYWYLNAGLGKIIPTGRWKNSGIWVKANFGYLGHKIHITDPDNLTDQLARNTYRKGYDQRSGGFCMTQFVGYFFMHRVRVASFYGGVEISEMWTKPNRSYIFTQGSTENMPYKLSCLVSVKIGWNIPVFEKKRTLTLYTD